MIQTLLKSFKISGRCWFSWIGGWESTKCSSFRSGGSPQYLNCTWRRGHSSRIYLLSKEVNMAYIHHLFIQRMAKVTHSKSLPLLFLLLLSNHSISIMAQEPSMQIWTDTWHKRDSGSFKKLYAKDALIFPPK